MTLIGTRRILSLMLAAAVTSTAFAGTRNIDGSARVQAFKADDGSSYFALMLKAKEQAGAEIRRHAILFDTSASQAGEHRDHALAVLDSLVKRFNAKDQVSLFAVDVQTKALTPSYVSPNSTEFSNGVDRLKKRIPLGATNLENAINEVLKTADGTATSIIYIGDGLSTANLILKDGLRDITVQCRKKHVVFNSYAVGPNRDYELLGILAVQTGGVVQTDNGRERLDDSATVAGYNLARATHQPVTYLTAMPSGLEAAEMYPKNPVPVRSDRESIFIGKGEFTPGPLTGVGRAADGENVRLQWSVAGSKLDKRNGVFVDLFNRAAEFEGLGSGVAGQSMLSMAKRKFALRNSVKVAMAQDNNLFGQEGQDATGAAGQAEQPPAGNEFEAFDGGDAAPAGDAMPAGQELPPGTPGGNEIAIPDTTTPAPTGGLVLPSDSLTIPQSSADDYLGPKTDADDDLLTEAEKRVRVRTEYLGRQVQATLRQAGNIQRDEPDVAINVLKDTLETIRSSTDIDRDARIDMLRRLQSSLNSVRAAQEVYEQNSAQLARKLAAQEARRSLITSLVLEEEKLQTLIETVRQHIEDARKGDDGAYEEAEVVARKAIDLRPGNGPATQAVFNAEAAGQLNKIYRLRALRSDRFLETLYQVERSHVPFPDEPPVIYPPAEVWNALSLRRIERWSSVDLAKETEAARRIRRALDGPTEPIQGGDSLKSILDFISEVHGFTIIPDKLALDELQIESLEDITVAEDLSLSDITLKSAMKIIFEQLESVDEPLTYIIKNEVMYILSLIHI